MTFTLTEVERAIRNAWGSDTTNLDAVRRERWTSELPAQGQCGATALVVQDLLGGDLLISDVTGGSEQDRVHYWNRLVGGVEIDLTREQFAPHRVIGPPRVVVRPPGWTADFYELLQGRVFDALGHLAA